MAMKQFSMPIDIDRLPDAELIEAIFEQPGGKRLSAWLYTISHDDEEMIPAALLGKLRQAYLVTLRNNIVLQKELVQLLHIFDAAGVQAIPLKGTSLVQRLYGDLGSRPSADVDILFNIEQAQSVETLMVEAGYHGSTKSKMGYHLKYQRQLGGMNPIHIELHQKLLGFISKDYFQGYGLLRSQDFTGSIWKRASSMTAEGYSYWQMNPADELLYLCLHLVTHHLLQEKRPSYQLDQRNPHSLMLALDIHLALARWGEELDWKILRDSIARFRLGNFFSLAIAYTESLFCTSESLHVPVASGMPDWKKKYFLELDVSGGKFGWINHKWPAKFKKMIDYLLLCDSWRDRLKIISLSTWELGRMIGGN